jgi:multidrug efflux pump subunit AcrA (membrane-fusion protein)
MKRRRWWWGAAVLLTIAAALATVAVRVRIAQAAPTLPTAPARKGDFLVVVRCRGELKARRSVQVAAPVSVQELRIVWMAPTGASVKEGDPVVRFDPSAAKQLLDEKQAALKQAEAALAQALAQAGVDAEQDKLDTSTAAYEVEHARLEVSKAEVVSPLEGEESRVDLGLAEQKLALQKATNQFNRASGAAKIASLTRARDKARDEVELNQQRLDLMELKAPISGMVQYMPNFSQGWLNAKPFKVGDQAWPGSVIAEVPDLSTLEMEGKVDEIDRGRIALNQEVKVRIDSLPENTFEARLAQLSPLTEMSWEWPPTSSFRGFARIEKPDARLRPSMNGSMDVVVNRIPNAISIPAKAVFTRKGKAVVFAAEAGKYEEKQIEVLARNPDEVAVRGIAENTQVTTVEPGKQEQKR